ncbi:MAG TPA: hypothetical protein VN493_18135 [Thermoanaerobaculia bacterium]|nr:hypothetical protein [Thermoanaerobaculia bacterium]
MKRAIATFGLIGLLTASFLAAEDGAPAAAVGEPAGLCAASTPTSPELTGFLPRPHQRVTCSAAVTCPNGSQVSCFSGTWDLCETFYDCSFPYAECGVRCLNNFRYCPGYNQSNCSC